MFCLRCLDCCLFLFFCGCHFGGPRRGSLLVPPAAAAAPLLREQPRSSLARVVRVSGVETPAAPIVFMHKRVASLHDSFSSSPFFSSLSLFISPARPNNTNTTAAAPAPAAPAPPCRPLVSCPTPWTQQTPDRRRAAVPPWALRGTARRCTASTRRNRRRAPGVLHSLLSRAFKIYCLLSIDRSYPLIINRSSHARYHHYYLKRRSLLKAKGRQSTDPPNPPHEAELQQMGNHKE